MGFLHREGGIGGDTSHNALKWVPSTYNSFDHFPYNERNKDSSSSSTQIIKSSPD